MISVLLFRRKLLDGALWKELRMNYGMKWRKATTHILRYLLKCCPPSVAWVALPVLVYYLDILVQKDGCIIHFSQQKNRKSKGEKDAAPVLGVRHNEKNNFLLAKFTEKKVMTLRVSRM